MPDSSFRLCPEEPKMSAHSAPEQPLVPPTVAAPRKRKANGSAPAAEQIGLQELLSALQGMKAGDFSVRMRSDQVGIAGKIADAFNDIVASNERMAAQLEKV